MTDRPAVARNGLYGPVGLLSALVTLVVFAAASADYAGSGTLAHAAIAVLAAAVLVTNLVAALIARRGDRKSVV